MAVSVSLRAPPSYNMHLKKQHMREREHYNILNSISRMLEITNFCDFLSQNETKYISSTLIKVVNYRWIINILYYYENTRGGFKNTDKLYIVTVECLLA